MSELVPMPEERPPWGLLPPGCKDLLDVIKLKDVNPLQLNLQRLNELANEISQRRFAMTPPAEHKRPFLSTSFRIDGVFDVLIFLALAGSWLGLLGKWHWALDLLSHFRWQYLAACVVALIWTLWRRRRLVTVMAVATFVLNGWLIGSLMTGPRSAAVTERLRVVSLNVLISNPKQEDVLKYLREADADVILLMEVDARWAMALRPLRESHPYGVMHAREDNFGVALFSRRPLKEAREVSDLSGAGLPSVVARLTHGDRDLVILGTHPLPPVGRLKAEERDAQLAEVADLAAKMTLPLLVVGDLNATPWSHGMEVLTSGGKLKLGGGMRDALPTWKVGTVMAIPIDHALCSAPLTIIKKTVGRDVGSDHRPIEIEVGWEP